MLCSRLKTSKFLAGPRSPTSPVTAQLISRRERCVSFWCFADFQQRLNEWLVVLPQTRSSSFHGVKAFSRLDGMKVFRIIQSYGLAVLPQTQPSSFHSLEKLFRPDVMQPFKTIQVCGWAVLPNIPCHVPAHFTALKNHFVWMLCRLSTTFKSTAGRAPPNTIQLISRCQKFLIWMVGNSSKTFEFMAGPCSPNYGPVPFTMLKNLFVWRLCTRLKLFKLMAGPRSPTSPVTAQLISRRWRIFL